MIPKSSSCSDKLWVYLWETFTSHHHTKPKPNSFPSLVILIIISLLILWSGFLDHFYCLLSAWLEPWSLESWDMKCTFLATITNKNSCKLKQKLDNEIRLTLAKISNLGVFNYFSLSSYFTLEWLESWVQKKEHGNRVYMACWSSTWSDNLSAHYFSAPVTFHFLPQALAHKVIFKLSPDVTPGALWRTIHHQSRT